MSSRGSRSVARPRPAVSSRPLDSRPVRAVLRGLAGGLIATVVMTVYRLPIFRALPPTAEFWSTYLGDGPPERYLGIGLVLHVLYGSAAGAVYGPIFSTLDSKTSIDRDWLAVGAGLAYGLVLSVVGTRLIFPHVLGSDLAEDERLVFHVGHVVYGLTLGTWVGSREEFGDVYD